MPKFYDSKGWLTSYALACGYIHRVDVDKESSVVLEHLSGSAYGVTTWDRSTRGATNSRGATLRDGIAFYEGFDSLSEARKAYRAQLSTRGGIRRRFESAPDIARDVIQ